jgi:long-chain acyl-CoA synthetase
MTRASPGLHHFLRAAAERQPEHPAFIRKDRVTTYGELERDASRFAAGLRRLGIGRGDRVALVLDTEVEFLIAYYGIAKAGAAVVPLCSDTRTSPLVYALAHSDARAVILDGSNLRYLAGQAGALPALRWIIQRGKGELVDPGHLELRDFDSLVAAGEELSDAGASGDDLLSITYTSGTTGRPKGVMLAHRNLVANVRSIVEYLELGPADRVAMVLPFYYVYGNSVLHTHICAGGTIVQAGTLTFPAEVLKQIADHRCTGFSGVPATFARLLGVAGIANSDLSSLRYITQAGAAMTPALTERLRGAFPGVRIFVMYGQTEAAARLAYVPPDALDRKIGSAGKAIPGVVLRILDAEGHEVPRGTVGEVVAQGDNVMLGYWKDPDETARTLRADGLHTGDLASMDEDGFLFITGRESEMIKSGAHRIGPGEIESAVELVPGVRECAVAGVPDPLLGQAIAAFIVPEDGAAIDRQMVLRSCLNELPRFKLPEHVFVLSELPRTATGKVRRQALVEWYLSQSPGAAPPSEA